MRSWMKIRIGGIGLLVMITLLATSGLWNHARAEVDEIRICDGKGDWGYPNPFLHYPRGPGYLRMSWVFDTLVWKDHSGFIPALAISWRYDPEKLAYVFDLNSKAMWHDGQPVTAEDVAFTISYFKKNPYDWVTLEGVDRAEASDKHKVVIYLKKPYSPFISDIAASVPILPKHIWQTVNEPRRFVEPKAFIGSGPYKFVDFNKAKGTYLYTAFDGYYQGKPKAERLIYFKGNPLMTLSTGKADLASIKPDTAPVLKEKGMVILTDKHGWNKKLMINHKKPPFNDRRFRQALAYVINQQEIIDKAHRGLGAPASYGLLSRDHEWYNPETPDYPFDRKKAQEIIASLGFLKGADGFFSRDGRPLKIDLLVSNIGVAGERTPDRDGEVIKRQLEAAGIRVDLTNLEQTVTDSRIKKWDFDLAISGHGAILGDPKILNEMISSSYGAGSVNSARFDENQELNRLLEEQISEMDPERRKALVYKIQKVYAEELPAISLYYPEGMAAYNPKKGIHWFYTKGGISKGIPIAQNKMSLIR
jgi:peptide/nickel transport system substrate-binding protein